MYSRHETAGALNTSQPVRQRIDAAGHVASKAPPVSSTDRDRAPSMNGMSRVDALDQQGSARIRLPNAHGGPLQAVLINTAGGLTGDDQIRWSATAGEASRLVISTAACEKLYRTHGPAARQQTRLVVENGARLDWLPQETIVFNGARLVRRLEAQLAYDATALIGESLVLGRQAMRESVDALQLRDSWRIHRGDRLLHAEELDLQFGPHVDARKASNLHHYSAISTLVWVTPLGEEALQLKSRQLRQRIPDDRSRIIAGVTAMEHRLVLRVLASDSLCLRRFLIPCIEALSDSQPIPQVWNV